MPKKFTDTGSANAVEVRRDTSYDHNTGQKVETYVMAEDDVSTFLAGNLPPYTSSQAPFAFPVASFSESRENGVATITIIRDFGYNDSGAITDPTSDDLSETFEILSVEKTDPLSQIPYLKNNLITSYPNVDTETTANLLKNIRLRTLHELLALPQSERPSPSDSYLPTFVTQFKKFDPAWDEFLVQAGSIPGETGSDDVNLNQFKNVALEDDGTEKTRPVYVFGRDSELVTKETMMEEWSLKIPVSHLLGGDQSITPSSLQDGGSAWPEWGIFEHVFDNGTEGIFRYDYMLRKSTTRSSAYTAQHSLLNVGKIKPHANILSELGASSGDLRFVFTSDFTGTGWLKQAPNITTQANGSFKITQDYLNVSAKELNTNIYETF